MIPSISLDDIRCTMQASIEGIADSSDSGKRAQGREAYERGYRIKKGGEAPDLPIKERFKEALKWFEAAMHLDYEPAFTQAGKLYWQGRIEGLSRKDSVKKGIELILEGAKKGDPRGIYNKATFLIGGLYQEAGTRTDNIRLGLECIESIKEEIPDALGWSTIGHNILPYEINTEGFTAKKRKLYELSVEMIRQQDPHGLIDLGEMLQNGEIPPDELSRAAEIYNQAKHDIPKYLHMQIEHLPKWSKKHRRALNRLAGLYSSHLVTDSRGRPLPKQEALSMAIHLLQEAVASGSYSAKRELATLYSSHGVVDERGYPIPKNEALRRAHSLLKEAVEAGAFNAHLRLFYLYKTPNCTTLFEFPSEGKKYRVQCELLEEEIDRALSPHAFYHLAALSDIRKEPRLLKEADHRGHFISKMIRSMRERSSSKMAAALGQVGRNGYTLAFTKYSPQDDRLLRTFVDLLYRHPNLLELFDYRIVRDLINQRDGAAMKRFFPILSLERLIDFFQQHANTCRLLNTPDLLSEDVARGGPEDEPLSIETLIDQSFELFTNKGMSLSDLQKKLSALNIFHVIGALASSRLKPKVVAMQSLMPNFTDVISTFEPWQTFSTTFKTADLKDPALIKQFALQIYDVREKLALQKESPETRLLLATIDEFINGVMEHFDRGVEDILTGEPTKDFNPIIGIPLSGTKLFSTPPLEESHVDDLRKYILTKPFLMTLVAKESGLDDLLPLLYINWISNESLTSCKTTQRHPFIQPETTILRWNGGNFAFQRPFPIYNAADMPIQVADYQGTSWEYTEMTRTLKNLLYAFRLKEVLCTHREEESLIAFIHAFQQKL